MVVVPWFLPVARPLLDVTPATFVAEELHVARFEMSCAVPSEKLPVAVNCCWVPTSMDGLVGVTVRELSVALETFSVPVPDTLPELAVIVVAPPETPVATPLVPEVLLIVATAGEEEVHETEVVRF